MGSCLVGCEIPENRRGAPTLGALLLPPTPEEAAQWALDEEDADKRARGTRLLANAPFGGGDVYLTMYRTYVEDESPLVRAAAARALGNHGSPGDAPLLAALLKDDEELAQFDAAQALQRIHNPAVVSSMLSRTEPNELLERDPDVRAAVITGLGQYERASVIEALIPRLDDRSLRVAYAARDSLRVLTGQDFGLDRRAWSGWYASADDPFAASGRYQYPVFQRDRFLYEYIPFIPGPPNEQPADPAGIRVSEDG